MHHNVQGNVLIPRPRLLVHCEVSEPGKLLLSLCKANEHLRMHLNKTLRSVTFIDSFLQYAFHMVLNFVPFSSLIILNPSA